MRWCCCTSLFTSSTGRIPAYWNNKKQETFLIDVWQPYDHMVILHPGSYLGILSRLDSLSSPPASAGLFSPHSPATGSQSDPWQHGAAAVSPKGRRKRMKELRTSRAERSWRKRMKDGQQDGQTETNQRCSLKQEEPTVGSYWPCGLYVVMSQMATILSCDVTDRGCVCECGWGCYWLTYRAAEPAAELCSFLVK